MPSTDKPTLDLSRYVALGDSITAGYADGALYYEGQLGSYANIVAHQITLASGGVFKQPLMSPESVGVDLMGNSRLTLVRKANNPEVLLLRHLAPIGDLLALRENNYKVYGPYTNMGVPGAKVITTVFPGFGNPMNGSGNYNPFFTRMASDPVKASVLSDALLNNPTFFSVFIGNNDVLAYALAGCTENAMSPPKGDPGYGFEGSLVAIVDAMMADRAKGVIANLPSIANIPYFNTIPYDGLILDAKEAVLLNQKYRSAGIQFQKGNNAFLVSDAEHPNKERQAKKGELILMDLLLDPNGTDYLKGKTSIPKKYTLTPDEALSVEKTTETYNTIIRSVAIEKKLAFVDIHRLVKSARADRYYNPTTLTLDYAKKGVFSLDGLHPNAFGQALLANEFMKAINLTHGTSLQTVKSHSYHGIVLP